MARRYSLTRPQGVALPEQPTNTSLYTTQRAFVALLLTTSPQFVLGHTLYLSTELSNVGSTFDSLGPHGVIDFKQSRHADCQS